MFKPCTPKSIVKIREMIANRERFDREVDEFVNESDDQQVEDASESKSEETTEGGSASKRPRFDDFDSRDSLPTQGLI